ncbi:BTAD domain-containing putative transcriptional regulator [Streptomyces sp. NPDC004250]|uniref:AfsR/SARP family transcriptional regulator n=1 Tax=Streptomyces sp. NPDC004250 TaxID=3364692 RepID=UPI0036BDFA8B
MGRHTAVVAPPEPTASHWPPAEGLALAVLGPVRVWRDGEAVSAGSPQQRAVLAALLLREGRTASAAELLDALRDETTTRKPTHTAIRTYTARLRKILGPETLASEDGRYTLRVDRATVDIEVARDLAAESRARAADDLPRASALIGRALALWDGEPLAGVPGPFAETQRTRLEEWHLQLVETQIDLDLELGNHAEVVARLTALTAMHPLHESLREALMLALYRSGRQAEALAVYEDVRRLVANELGVEPSRELQELQQRILRADDTLLPTSGPSPAGEPSEASPPRQLPADIPDFTGRISLVQELADLLGTRDGRVVSISAVTGMGGVGKTAFAVHVAHAARARFPDGQLYADLYGAGPQAAEPTAVLGLFLRALGVPDSSIPGPIDERAALYRATLEGRRVLVVLDNARNAAQVRPLLPGTGDCAVLITSRTRMVDLAGVHLVDLDAMAPEEALRFFSTIVGEERVDPERTAALDVVAACGFLPLAIRIAASRLAARRTWTVSVLAAKLADERRRLDELQAGDLAVKATFELGYGQLEPAQARAFRLLGLADGPDISLVAAAAVLGLPAEDTEGLLESLVDTSLLESSAPGRYRYNDLVRLYARACAERDEQPAEERERALSRLLDFYLATAVGVYVLERPGDRLVEHLEPTRCEGLVLRDRNDALDWLFGEALCVTACARQSTTRPHLRRAVDLLWVTRDLSESGAYSPQYESAAVVLYEAAEALRDPRATGRAGLILAETRLLSGRSDAIEQQADRISAVADEAGDTQVLCRLALLRGAVALRQGQHEKAVTHYTYALDSFRAEGDRPGEAGTLCSLSRVRLFLGDITGAISLAEQGVAAFDGLGGRSVRDANARYTLGLALTQAARYSEARHVLTESRELFREARHRFWEGQTHFRLAEVDLADQRPRDAAAHAEQALSTLDTLGMPLSRANTLTVLGRALNTMGETDRARACWRDALALYDEYEPAESQEVRNLLAASATPSR